MALELSTVDSNGNTGNYWKITYYSIDIPGQIVDCEICLFKDAAASAAGKSPMQKQAFEWGPGDYAGNFDPTTLSAVDVNPQERAYELIKVATVPVDFTTSTDV